MDRERTGRLTKSLLTYQVRREWTRTILVSTVTIYRDIPAERILRFYKKQLGQELIYQLSVRVSYRDLSAEEMKLLAANRQ